MDFLEELRWRGMIHDMSAGLEAHLKTGAVKAYIGFDPTAPSLTIGNYVQVMLLTFLQKSGHIPVVLLGGATGRIGDPSGKDKERELKTYDELDRNIEFQKKQFEKCFENKNTVSESVLIVNNYDFYQNMNVLDFLRDVGKLLTVNVMLSKDSVQRRLDSGISFTEFSYQLLQGWDFVELNRQHGVTLQMGGSDQFGNIVAGTELGRKAADLKLYALTTPLLTKADGTKFGKSEAGNIWLDPTLTSPYRFYQFWINADDRDLPKFLRYFSLKTRAEIEALEAAADPQQTKRVLAEELTVRLHGVQEFQSVLSVSQLLFDAKANAETCQNMSEKALETVADEIPSPKVSSTIFSVGIGILDFLAEQTNILPSKTEAKNAIKGNAISLNKQKISALDFVISRENLLYGRFLMVENGKKNKYLVEVKN